jgi:oligosaccharide repeat unit polymerase
MSYLSAICFLATLAIFCSMLRKGADVFSPGRVFGSIWFTGIGLADLKLSYYQSAWSGYSWAVIFLGVAAFYVGVFVVSVLNLEKKLVPIREMRGRLTGSLASERRLFTVVLVMFAAYITCYLTEAGILGYVPLFSARPDRARIEFGLFGLHLVVNAMPVLLLLVVEYFLLARAPRGRRVVVWGVLVTTVVTFFLMLQRFDFVVGVLLVVCFAYYTSNALRLSRIWWIASIFGVLLYAIQSIRITTYVQNYLYVISRMRYSITYAAFTEPYMYIVMNFENYARSVERLQHYQYGYFSTDFLLALTGLKHWLADYLHIVERPFLVSGYNTYPLFWTYYYDFGILGVGFSALLLGMGIAFIYYRMRTSPTILNVGLYSFFFFVLVISFFTNPLTMLKTHFSILIWVAAQVYVLRSGPERVSVATVPR